MFARKFQSRNMVIAALPGVYGISRDGEVKCGTQARHSFAFHPDVASHQGAQAFADRQAETGASIFAGGGGVHLVKRLKETIEPVFRNSDPGVAHGEVYLAAQSCRVS